MVLELAEFFPQLLAALGGEDLPEKLAEEPTAVIADSAAPEPAEAELA